MYQKFLFTMKVFDGKSGKKSLTAYTIFSNYKDGFKNYKHKLHDLLFLKQHLIILIFEL